MNVRLPLIAAFGLLSLASPPSTATAQSGEKSALPQIKTEVAFPNLNFRRPVAFASVGEGADELIYVVEQDGVISSFPNDPNVSERKVLLDIRPKVNRDHNEEGLLGLAFHPKFRENGQFFVYYSTWKPGPRRSVVSRWKTKPGDPRTADPASEEIIWESEEDPYGNHNGGCIEFGPDGFLYISLGDSGAADDPLVSGQNPKDWWGSILRIDVDRPTDGKPYGIPADNPALGSPKHKHWAPEVYCIGLRNVWKFSFDRKAPHELWAGDVGQNLWEIVHVIENGGNYGWSIFEGTHPFPPKARQRRDTASPITKAIVDYSHSLGKSITGGYVYRGKAFPALDGVYIYGDYDSGRIWGLKREGGKVQAVGEILDLKKQQKVNITAFGQDAAGELYVLPDGGQIRKIVLAE